MIVTKLPLAIVSTDKDLIDLIRHCDNYDLIGVFDANPGANTGGVKIFGPDERFREILSVHPGMQVAMAIDPPKLKRKLVSHYGIENLVTIMPRDAYIAPSVALGQLDPTIDAIVTGTVDGTTQYTLDDIWGLGPFNWQDHSGMTNFVADDTDSLIAPVTAIRLLTNSGLGSIAFTVTQAGVQ